MKKMLINATQKEEIRIAIVYGKRLHDLDIEDTQHKQKKSNIYKGKISHFEPSLGAVFIDYGMEKHGFLPLKEISQEYLPDYIHNDVMNNNLLIKNILVEGKEIIVQINKEERGNKGASLTTFLSLASSYLVLLPNNPHIRGISKKIKKSEKNTLKDILSLLPIPDNMGLIIRTAGLGQDIKVLKTDLKFRLKHWNFLKKVSNNNPAPFLIHQESNIIIRALRDYLSKDIHEILIDNITILKLAKKYINLLGRTELSHKLKLYNGTIPLFSYYQIETQIETAFQRKVKLSSGGSIIIDTTEALTSIDVNSSKATQGSDIEETAFNINLEAADEIARQLRLRDVGGLIVIDFIDMSPVKHQRAIEQRLKEQIKDDRAKIKINQISKFGLLEMSRQRLSSSLKESNYYTCPRCSGNSIIRNNKSLSLSILRLIEEVSFKDRTKEIHVIVPTKIAFYLLNIKKEVINTIENRNIKVFIIPNNELNTPNYHLTRIKHSTNIKNIHYLSKKKSNIQKNSNDQYNKDFLLHNNFFDYNIFNKYTLFSNKKFFLHKVILLLKFMFKLNKQYIYLLLNMINNLFNNMIYSMHWIINNIFFIKNIIYSKTYKSIKNNNLSHIITFNNYYILPKNKYFLVTNNNFNLFKKSFKLNNIFLYGFNNYNNFHQNFLNNIYFLKNPKNNICLKKKYKLVTFTNITQKYKWKLWSYYAQYNLIYQIKYKYKYHYSTNHISNIYKFNKIYFNINNFFNLINIKNNNYAYKKIIYNNDKLNHIANTNKNIHNIIHTKFNINKNNKGAGGHIAKQYATSPVKRP
ncbi:Rne/Rng family ribonuclease [Enterobacteriaceae endosymbiont of Neohaemonia nigricornis]|nr:Rne/Rng family ribonuclease [Enterobacteriaceae endosymbiont of Neohaemonia nigricornis]